MEVVAAFHRRITPEKSASVLEFWSGLNTGIPGPWGVLPGLIVVCFGRLWVRGLPFPNARHLGHPFQWKNTLPWHLSPASQNSPLQKSSAIPALPRPSTPRLWYSPGLAPTTRLNALLNAASDS
jgi:hypothetical protein